jgi:hypothetical protein
MATSSDKSKAGLTLFLGSGFSGALGLPTTETLSRKLLTNPEGSVDQPLEAFISARIRGFWQAVFGWQDGTHPPTLEDHFTQIDMAANAGHNLGANYTPKKLRAIRRLTIHRIFSLLKSQGFQVERILEFFKRVHEKFEITIITTNWDWEAERCLELLHIPHHDGVDVITETGTQPPGMGVPILKLHGSTNRGYCDCCRMLVSFGEQLVEQVVNLKLLLEPDDFRLFGEEDLADRLARSRRWRTCTGCGGSIGMRVATFSYRKDMNPHAFHAIWGGAQTSLQLAGKWLFVGYSLPEADIEIRHLLKSAQLARPDSRKVSINVVLKEDCDAGERYERFFGITDDFVFQDGIDEWIGRNLEDYMAI